MARHIYVFLSAWFVVSTVCADKLIIKGPKGGEQTTLEITKEVRDQFRYLVEMAPSIGVDSKIILPDFYGYTERGYKECVDAIRNLCNFAADPESLVWHNVSFYPLFIYADRLGYAFEFPEKLRFFLCKITGIPFVGEIEKKGHYVLTMAMSPCGRYLYAGYSKTVAHLWDIHDKDNPELVTQFGGQTVNMISSAYSPCGRYIVAISFDGIGHIVDVQDKRNIGTAALIDYTPTITSAACSPHGDYLVTGSTDSKATLWKMTDNLYPKRCAQLAGHMDSVTTVQFSPCGTRILTGSRDGSIRVWDISNERYDQSVMFERYAREVRSAVFSPCGNYVAIAFVDGVVGLWNWRTGVVNLLEKNDSEDTVMKVAFSPCGKYLLVGTKHKKARVLYIEWGKRPASVTLSECGSGCFSVGFTINGRYAITGDDDGCIKMWDLKKYLELDMQSCAILLDYANAPDRDVFIMEHEDLIDQLPGSVKPKIPTVSLGKQLVYSVSNWISGKV